MKKTISVLLTVVLLLTSVLALPLAVSATTYYRLDFKAADMVFDATGNVWSKAVGDATCLNYPGYSVVDKGGAAAIRKFVLPNDGAVKLAWGGGVFIDNSQGNLTGATVQFAVTDKTGQILFPKNGDVATVKEGTPLEVSLDIASGKKGDALYVVVMNPSVDRMVCALNFGVMVDGEPYSNGSGQLYDGILQGGSGWYHQYADKVTKLKAAGKPDLGEPETPTTSAPQQSQPEGGDTTPTAPVTPLEEQTNGFVEMKAFMDGWWWADSQGQNPASPSFSMANGTHTQPPAPGYMTAKGFKVATDGVVSFSGTVMLDINATMGVPENTDTVGFMVIEKNSNMVLYPSDKAEFMVMKNTEKNRTEPTMISGTFEAKAGDEILFITRNETTDLHPSVQVIMDIYREENGEKVKIGNTHEGFSNKQGKNNWRYYYASIKGFKTPMVPAKPIFQKASYYDEAKQTWYLLPESVNEKVTASYLANIGKGALTVTQHTGAAIGYKAASAGKVSYNFSHEGAAADKQVGFCVVKKSTFEAATAWKLLSSKKETISGSFTAAKGDEYLFVVAMLGVGDPVTLSTDMTVNGGGTGEMNYYFAPVADICTELLKTERSESPYLSADDVGIRDVIFDPKQLTQFDEEKWMWSVSDWENPASNGYMAVLLEGAHVSTPHYSLVRSYKAESDCVISVYGNMFSEVPEFLGAAPNEPLFDFMVCNDKGQIMYPEDQSGFYTFKASDLTVDKPIVINVSAKAAAGDKVYIVFRNRSDKAFAYLYTHFQIFETPEGENPSVPLTGTAEGFSDTQGANGWNYYYTTNDSYRFVKGTKLEKVITGNASVNTEKPDDSKEEPDEQQTAAPDPLMTVMFWVSAGVDLISIVLLVLYILWKVRKKSAVTVPPETDLPEAAEASEDSPVKQPTTEASDEEETPTP
ncbi:MAG: hypothetical protein IJC17_05715 [Clostridia bacterium]|nr:hypothetical protein [Clostridia bacterium]